MRLFTWTLVLLAITYTAQGQGDTYTVTTLVQDITNAGIEGLAFDSKNNQLYTPSGPSGTAFQISSNDGNAVQILASIGFPQGGTVDREGNYYVSNWEGGQILKYNPTVPSVEVFATGPQGPTGLAIDPSGDTLYVANWSNSTIYKTSLTEGRLTRFVSGNGISNPDGLAFDANGNLYVAMAQADNGRIMRVTPNGNVSLFVNIEETSTTGYIALHHNTLYVSGHDANKIYAVDIPSQTWRVLAGTGQFGQRDGNASEATFSDPLGIAVSPDGLQIYVVDPPNRGIRVISKTLTDVRIETEVPGPPAALAQNYPNPFVDATTIAFTLPDPQAITLALYSVTGQHIRTLAQGVYPTGQHVLDVSRDGLATGSYVLRLLTSRGVSTRTVSIVR